MMAFECCKRWVHWWVHLLGKNNNNNNNNNTLL